MPPTAIFRYQESPGKGMGCFANKNIPLGTPIFHEAPILESEKTTPIEIWTRYVQMERSAKYFPDLYRLLPEVGHLPPLPPGTKVPDLSNGIGQNEATRFKAYAASLWANNAVISMDRDAASRIIAIFETNCFKIANKSDTADAWAVFMKASRLNHSCIPNCYASWSKSLHELFVHAVRDIKEDEELTITYDAEDHFFERWEERMARLYTKYGFNCFCQACDLLSTTTDEFQERESKRDKIADLTNRIAPLTTVWGEGTADVDALRTERLQLKAEQGFGTWEGGKAHHELAKIHEAYGRLDSAITQLKEALTIAESSLCDGHEKTKEVREDLYGVTLMKNELVEDAMASSLE